MSRQTHGPSPAPISMAADRLLTVNEACSILGVSRATLYTMMARGEIAYTRVASDRRIAQRAIAEYVDKYTVAASR